MTIVNHIKYIEEEIDIRIESMKMELDELQEIFNIKLEALKNEKIG
jgi:hypothetical protein